MGKMPFPCIPHIYRSVLFRQDSLASAVKAYRMGVGAEFIECCILSPLLKTIHARRLLLPLSMRSLSRFLDSVSVLPLLYRVCGRFASRNGEVAQRASQMHQMPRIQHRGRFTGNCESLQHER